MKDENMSNLSFSTSFSLSVSSCSNSSSLCSPTSFSSSSYSITNSNPSHDTHRQMKTIIKENNSGSDGTIIADSNIYNSCCENVNSAINSNAIFDSSSASELPFSSTVTSSSFSSRYDLRDMLLLREKLDSTSSCNFSLPSCFSPSSLSINNNTYYHGHKPNYHILRNNHKHNNCNVHNIFSLTGNNNNCLYHPYRYNTSPNNNQAINSNRSAYNCFIKKRNDCIPADLSSHMSRLLSKRLRLACIRKNSNFCSSSSCSSTFSSSSTTSCCCDCSNISKSLCYNIVNNNNNDMANIQNLDDHSISSTHSCICCNTNHNSNNVIYHKSSCCYNRLKNFALLGATTQNLSGGTKCRKRKRGVSCLDIMQILRCITCNMIDFSGHKYGDYVICKNCGNNDFVVVRELSPSKDAMGGGR